MGDLNDLRKSAVVVGSLAAVVLVTLAVVFTFDLTLRDRTTQAIDGITTGDIDVSTAVGISGQFPFLQELNSCINASNSEALSLSSDYSFDIGNEDGGTITILTAGTGFANSTINCTTVTSLQPNTASDAAGLFQAGITIFATFLGIIVLALVGNVVVKLFKREED